MKKLREGEIRFRVKQIGKLFRVYDWARGSFPTRTDELGPVKQDVSEDEAKLEADRLNQKHMGSASPKKRKQSKKTVELKDLPDAPPAPLPDLPDYGIMSEEERKKYEDGLIEKVTY